MTDSGDRSSRLRVLHCPTITGGNPQQLARAERISGLDSWCVAFSSNYLEYPCDEILWEKNLSLFDQQVRCWRLLAKAAKDYDVIHYNSGCSILPWNFSEQWAQSRTLKWIAYRLYTRWSRFCEQRLLQHKVLAVTYQGDDARQGVFSLANFPISIAQEVGNDYYSPQSDARKQTRIAWFDVYVDLIYALNPDLLWVLPKHATFLPYASVDIAEWVPVNKEPSSVPLVLHAPSHRGVKGTRFIVDAVARLKSEGISFEFILVENMSNTEARKLYERADIIIDQLLAGWYGGLAVEAMALGKPVVCFLRETDFVFIPDQMRQELPLINADPGSIYAVLRDWLTIHRTELVSRGNLGRAFVERWHNPAKIAEKLKHDYLRVHAEKTAFP